MGKIINITKDELRILINEDPKEIINRFNEHKECSLSNMHEKTINKYFDIGYYDIIDEDDPIRIPDIIDEIGKEGAKLIMNYKYKDENNKAEHGFIYLPDDLVKKIGIDKLYICNYKENEYQYQSSNYIYEYYDNESTLAIDMYFCEYLVDEDEVYEYIVTEIYNMLRDMKWVMDNTYDEIIENMKEQKDIMKKLFESFTEEDDI